MTENRPYYKTRLRSRGRITLPPEIRDHLGIHDGDDVVFYVSGSGQIVVEPLRAIDPEQAWFWTERWQKMEREVQADIDAGRVKSFDSVDDFIKYLQEPKVLKALSLLAENPRHPSLQAKPLQGIMGVLEARVDISYHMTYERLPGNVLLLRAIGKHDETLKNL